MISYLLDLITSWLLGLMTSWLLVAYICDLHLCLDLIFIWAFL